MNIESFKEAFHAGTGSCRRECACGIQFYNSDGGWNWEEGELERLEADKTSRDLDCTIAEVEFFDIEYVYQCDCWYEKAKQFMEVVDNHAHGIAQYLTLEKLRMQAEVDNMPTV